MLGLKLNHVSKRGPRELELGLGERIVFILIDGLEETYCLKVLSNVNSFACKRKIHSPYSAFSVLESGVHSLNPMYKCMGQTVMLRTLPLISGLNRVILTYSQVPLLCGMIYHGITYDIAITVAESESVIKITTGTPYLALTGELWCDCCEDFGENWPCYDGTTLHFCFLVLCLIASNSLLSLLIRALV